VVLPLGATPPVGYLVTVTLIAVGTACALVPPRRPAKLGRIAFFFSTGLNEIPFLVFGGLLAATVLAFAEGDIDSAPASAAVGLAGLTSIGLLLVVPRRALRTRAAVERALEDELGAGQHGGELPSRPAARWPLARIVAAPWLVRRAGAKRFPDIPYGEAGRRQLLDVYRHRSLPSPAPTLVYFHGGGYFSGAKNREARPLLYRLASQGWTCISANYRLRPEVTYPDHLIDAKRVIAWVREHGGEHGADPARVVVAGSSAGGHLAALLALTPDNPSLQPGFEPVDTSVSAAICLYGYLGNYYGQGPESSPRHYVRADAPPFFIAQGEMDTYSPRFVAIACDFAERLRSVSSNPVVYAELPGAQHGFDRFHSIRFEAVIDGIEAFVQSAGLQGADCQLPYTSLDR
jgi:acetyl esterase/lipase